MSGRKATTNIIPGDVALSVGMPDRQAPDGWQWVSLDQVATMATGHTPSRKKPEYWGGDIKWMAVKDARPHHGGTIRQTKEQTNPLGIDNSAAVLLPAGTVCLSRTGSIGYSVILGDEMATSQGFVNWICGEDLLPRFLQLIFFAENSFLHRISEGVAHTTIYFPEVKAFHVCIPSIDEQRGIVAEIEKQFSRLDEAVASLKRVKANLKRYKGAVLKAAVEGKLTEEWRKQNPDVEPASKLLERILAERRTKWEEAELAKMKTKGKEPKNDKWKEEFSLSPHVDSKGLPNLPNGWCYTNLACLVEEPKYGTSKKCTYEQKGLGVLRIPNIRDGVIDDEDMKFAEFDHAEIEAYRLVKDDLLVIRSNGSLELVGKSALARSSDCGYLYAGYLIRLRPIGATVRGSYLQSIMSSLMVRSQIERKAKSTSGVNNINAVELRTLRIPMCSIDEQKQLEHEVANRFSVADHLLEEIQKQIDKTRFLRHSILAACFGRSKLCRGVNT